MFTPTLTTRQQELFDTLKANFLATGFESFTIDEAARRYHCSKSTIYALGSSRDDIIRRVLVSFFKEITSRTTPQPQPSARAGLEEYFSSIEAALSPASPEFMRDCAREEVAQEVYSRNTEAAIEQIRSLLERGVASGEFHAKSVSFYSRLTQRTMEDIQRGFYAETVSAPAAYAALGDLLIRGLTTRR